MRSLTDLIKEEKEKGYKGKELTKRINDLIANSIKNKRKRGKK